MRISTGMIFDAGINTINRQTASLLHLQQQVANGRRLLVPSDDPVAAARALEVTQSRDVVAQFKANHNNANSALGLEEAQLASSTDIVARIRELAVQAGNTSLADSDRKALAFELRARFNEMIGLANATDGNGQYLFSGFMGSTKPFGGSVENIIAGNEISYCGDEGQRRLQISPTRALEVSDSGNDVFGRIRNGNGYYTTAYAAANTGGGVIDGGNVTDPAIWNGLSVKKYSISFSVDNTVIPPTTYYDILDADPLSATNGNSLLTGGVPTLPPTAATGQRAYIDGQPIVLKSQGAEPAFDLGANVIISGAPASGDNFDIAPSSAQSLFKTIAKLVGTLENASTGTVGNTAKLANDIGFALTNLDQANDNILRVRAAIGSRMGEIDTTASVADDVDLQYQQTLSQLQDLDYTKTITDLTRKQTDLEAAQK